MELHIKNMVCDRCIMAVNDAAIQVGLQPQSVTLGMLVLPDPVPAAALDELQEALTRLKFELIDDRRTQIATRVKTVIIDLIHGRTEPTALKLSEYIATTLQMDYQYLSKLFAAEEGTTIEQYVIRQKIERVKELLSYGQMSLNQIADDMGYSSVQHLSAQFRQVTGLTASAYKAAGHNDRRGLDAL
jgi:AraC-like DNA-binding protein